MLPPASRWYRYVPGATGQALKGIVHHQVKQTVCLEAKATTAEEVRGVRHFGLHSCIDSRVCHHHPAACTLPILQLLCTAVVWNIVISLWILLN